MKYGRRPHFFLKMEDDLNFSLKIKANLNSFLKIKANLNFFLNIKANLNFFLKIKDNLSFFWKIKGDLNLEDVYSKGEIRGKLRGNLECGSAQPSLFNLFSVCCHQIYQINQLS
jgi:hypothetical protein